VLWQHFKRWTAGADKRPFHDKTISVYLDVLQDAALPTRGSRHCLADSAKSAQGLICGLSSVLENPSLSMLNQLQLATLLVRLRVIVNDLSDTASTPGRRRGNSSPLIVDNLETKIAQLCHDREKFCNLERDFQVGTAHSPLPNKANAS
jgi:hypothetical protein